MFNLERFFRKENIDFDQYISDERHKTVTGREFSTKLRAVASECHYEDPDFNALNTVGITLYKITDNGLKNRMLTALILLKNNPKMCLHFISSRKIK